MNFDIEHTEYRLVTEYLEEQLWRAKERNDIPAIHKVEMVLSAFDEIVDLAKGEYDDCD